MKTYDDIQTVDRLTIATADEAGRHIHFLDLRREAAVAIARGEGPVELLAAGAYNAEAVEVLYFPASGRAGVAWGADAAWTDADGADDALERYFGVGGKEMCE